MKRIIIIAFLLFNFVFVQAQEKKETSTLDNETLQLIIDYGKTFLGTTYQYGSNTTANKGFDCSGFMNYIFKMGGVSLPRSSSDIYNSVGVAVDKTNVKVGDLLFFKTSSSGSISHVGVVSQIIGDKIMMLHVSTSQGVQEIEFLKSDYWRSRWVGAKQLLKDF
jgi:cell wall-associated NlpC family hydrolase